MLLFPSQSFVIIMCSALFIRRCFSSSTYTSTVSRAVTYPSWVSDAASHVTRMNDLLYPKLSNSDDQSLKARMHAVKKNPIYNFLHTYYRYSAEELKLYSPGMGVHLQVHDKEHSALLHSRFRQADNSEISYNPPRPLGPEGRYGWILLSQARDVLKATINRSPNLGCSGLHEWAMLYREHEKHQPTLNLRVPQETIDQMVEGGGMKCTHFDAFRFFHPEARAFNAVPSLSRTDQVLHEQPGCIHASMDLFKYAYKIYPLCSSSLVERTLAAALKARKVDMRASPYDVSEFDGCEEPIRVETAEGRKLYIQEQLQLMELAAPLRNELIDVYEQALSV